MARTVDVNRPAELRNDIVEYLVAHGLANLSLRPLAKALGCTPRVLLYHFGSKEKMVVQVLAQLRQQQRAAYAPIEAASLAEAYQIIWKRMSAPGSEPFFRLFFETYGIALRQPRLYKDFLRHTIDDWLSLIAEEIRGADCTRERARAVATVVLAGFRGFMLDLCTTHDRKRVDRAVNLWLHSLGPMLPSIKGGQS